MSKDILWTPESFGQTIGMIVKCVLRDSKICIVVKKDANIALCENNLYICFVSADGEKFGHTAFYGKIVSIEELKDGNLELLLSANLDLSNVVWVEIYRIGKRVIDRRFEIVT